MTRPLMPYEQIADVLEALPETLRETRRARRLTLEAAAAQIGTTGTTLSRIERRMVDPSFKQIHAITTWLGAPR